MASTKAPKPTKPKTRAHEVLQRLLADQAPLTAAQRKAFAARFSDTKCEAMGGRTKSEGVLADALDWAGVMAKAIKKHPLPLRRYGAPRFAWFLECARALADARVAQRAEGGDAGGAKARLEKAVGAAAEARKELFETLDALVEGDDAAEQALADVTGSADKPDHTVASIQGLTKLARGWLGRTDAESKALAASVGLTLAEIEAAEEAADALTVASSDKTIEGRVVTRDTPPVNRAEGRMLLEMRAAMKIFARANERNREIPKLVPSKATRAALAPSAGGKGKAEAAPAAPAGDA